MLHEHAEQADRYVEQQVHDGVAARRRLPFAQQGKTGADRRPEAIRLEVEGIERCAEDQQHPAGEQPAQQAPPRSGGIDVLRGHDSVTRFTCVPATLEPRIRNR